MNGEEHHPVPQPKDNAVILPRTEKYGVVTYTLYEDEETQTKMLLSVDSTGKAAECGIHFIFEGKVSPAPVPETGKIDRALQVFGTGLSRLMQGIDEVREMSTTKPLRWFNTTQTQMLANLTGGTGISDFNETLGQVYDPVQRKNVILRALQQSADSVEAYKERLSSVRLRREKSRSVPPENT